MIQKEFRGNYKIPFKITKKKKKKDSQVVNPENGFEL